MKRLLSWFVFLLLVTAHTFYVVSGEDSVCDGVLITSDEAESITARVDNDVIINVKSVVQNPDTIQFYMNLDYFDEGQCDNKKGELKFSEKCTIEYVFVNKALTFKVGGVDSKAAIKYTEDSPHQAVMVLQKKGVSFRGPLDAPGTDPIGEDCWPKDANNFQLTIPKALSDECIVQLELKFADASVKKLHVGAKECPVPSNHGPGTGPTTAPDATTTSVTGTTTTNPDVPVTVPEPGTGSVTMPDPASPTTLGSGTAVPGPEPASSTTPGTDTAAPGPNPASPATPGPGDTTTPVPGTATTSSEDGDLVIIIVCVVIGVVIILIIVGILIYCFCFKKKKDDEEDAEAGEGEGEGEGEGAAVAGDKDTEADGTQKSDAKEAAATDQPEAENTQRDSEKKGSDHTQSDGADNTQGE